jgi:hypothetical protein
MSATVEGVAGNSDKSRARNTTVVRRESTALHDSHVIDALRHSKLYRDYERTFTAATGLPLALRPAEFFGLPFHGKKTKTRSAPSLLMAKPLALFVCKHSRV